MRSRRHPRHIASLVAAVATLLVGAAAPALADHPGPAIVPFDGGGPRPIVNSGGDGASFELISTFYSGNQHTDVDYFTYKGEVFTAVGTLAFGPNGGGVAIIQLTNEDAVTPTFVSNHPSANCPGQPAGTGLQHDVEATPKGNVLLNTTFPGADQGDVQLILDATDAGGRCHDQHPLFGVSNVATNPQGGIEIIDVTNPFEPVEIGLTSHTGQAHTVNVDPRRPHIAYVGTSDGVTMANRNDESDTSRSETLDFDGFEVMDLSSCMYFPEGTSVDDKRDSCRPIVYRYRFGTDWTQGTITPGVVHGCHETELYPNDVMTCAGIDGSFVLDISGMFDDNGTPDNFRDDTIRGKSLPCRPRASMSNPLQGTAAIVTDCVNGGTDDAPQSLRIGPWIEMGQPSAVGPELIGFINHSGNQNVSAAEDVHIAHEAELTESGKFLLVTDERGGGILPTGAGCPVPGSNPSPLLNGGVHAYRVDQLHTTYPKVEGDTNEQVQAKAWSSYARTPAGDKAIFRASPKVPQATLCTVHVMQIIPGQNRIFAAYYSQGLQIIDFIEHDDGTIEFIDAGWMIPEDANYWAAPIFKMEFDEEAAEWTYWGVAGDFNLSSGRSVVDVFRATLPVPQMVQAAAPAPVDPTPEPGAEPPPPALPVTGGGLAALGLIGVASARVLRRR